MQKLNNQRFMKKIILVSMMTFAATGMFAQFNQGRMLVGGSAGIETSTEKDKTGSTTTTNGKWTSISLAPQFGYFVIDNLALGAVLDNSISKYNPESDNSSDLTLIDFSFQPFIRYYLNPGIFFQGAVGIGTGKSKVSEDGQSQERTYGTSSWSLAAGYAIFLNDNVAIEPMLGYGSDVSKYASTDFAPESKDISSGLFLRVGFQIYLGSK